MTPRGGPPKRKPSKKAILPEILILSEGKETEIGYLTAWYRIYRDKVRITFSNVNAPPFQLVEEAVKQKALSLREERRGGGRSYDAIWCIFDIDDHPKVTAAKLLALTNGVRLAISNPCIEVWFILHFQDQTAWVHRDVAQDMAQSLLKFKKQLPSEACAVLISKHDDASQRAVDLDHKHIADKSPAGENPSSNVWELINAIRG